MTFYTWSKTIDSQDSDSSGSGVDPVNNRALEKARASWDRTHRFSFTGSWQLPFGRGRKWMNGSRALDLTFGGWEISGIETLESGNPLNFGFSNSPYNYYPTSIAARRPDLVGAPAVVDNWRDMGPARFSTATINPVVCCLADFAYPAPFTVGTAGRNIIDGLPLVWTTVSAQQNFTIHERLRAQLRWDMNNPFKTFNFNTPNTTVDMKNPPELRQNDIGLCDRVLGRPALDEPDAGLHLVAGPVNSARCDNVCGTEITMHRTTRRDFLKTSIAATVLGGITGAIPTRAAAKRTATDWVQLGKSNVRVTRLAFGTGTYGGRVQRALGQEEFTKLVRHAYDRGIRFFETADAYRGMPQMLATALKGIPRDSYRLMTKFRLMERDNPQPTIDRLLKDLNTEYVDIMLMHCVRTPTWPEDLKRLEDAFEDAKSKKIMVAHGASCHGLQALRQFPGMQWLDVALLRTNHNGTRMDTLQMRDTDDLGDVNEVVTHAKQIKRQGTGLLGMKLVGEGRFTNAEDRDRAIQFAFDTAGVDAVTIGYKTTAEIDEVIERMERVLNA